MGVVGMGCEGIQVTLPKWRIDLSYPLAKPPIAIEVDGAVFSGGRHVRGGGVEKDCEKYCHLAIAGWRLMRVTSGQVKQGLALNWIQQALT
jgi:very-short-patch-repair endonuclease